MHIVSIITGLILVGIGCYGFNESGAKTALIPAYFGAALFLCGLIAALKPSAIKHAMHGAAMVGLLGTSGLYMGIKGMLEKKEGLAPTMQLIMGAVCLVFLVLCIRSFINVRKAREAAAKDQG